MSADDELLVLGDGARASLARGEAEVVIADSRSELTRFAGNEIHQSVGERFRHIRVRLIDGGRIGVGEVRGHGERAIALAFAAAEESRRVTTTPDVSPLPKPTPASGDDAVAFAVGGDDRVQRIFLIVEMLDKRNDAAFVLECTFLRFLRALVAQRDRKASIEKRQFP